jgi:hypothetical protein
MGEGLARAFEFIQDGARIAKEFPVLDGAVHAVPTVKRAGNMAAKIAQYQADIDRLPNLATSTFPFANETGRAIEIRMKVVSEGENRAITAVIPTDYPGEKGSTGMIIGYDSAQVNNNPAGSLNHNNDMGPTANRHGFVAIFTE